MSIEDVVLIATVREESRLGSATPISHRIEATQARVLSHAASDDDEPPDSLESGPAEKEPPKEAVTGLEADSPKGPTPKELAPTSKAPDKHGSDTFLAESASGSQDKIASTYGRWQTPKVTSEDDDWAFPVKTKKRGPKTSSSSSPSVK